MSDPTTRTILLYALSIAAGALAAGLGVLATQMAGADPINWRPVIAAAIGPVVAGLAASRLPRPEGAALAAQIDYLKAAGIPRREMVVVSQEEAIRGIVEEPAPPPAPPAESNFYTDEGPR